MGGIKKTEQEDRGASRSNSERKIETKFDYLYAYVIPWKWKPHPFVHNLEFSCRLLSKYVQMVFKPRQA